MRVDRDAAVGEDRAQHDAQERDLLGRGVQRLVGEEAADQAGARRRAVLADPVDDEVARLPAGCTGDSSLLR